MHKHKQKCAIALLIKPDQLPIFDSNYSKEFIDYLNRFRDPKIREFLLNNILIRSVSFQ